MERATLEQRLTALGESVGDRLSAEQRNLLAKFITVGEYRIALEMIADWLSEVGVPVAESERDEAEALATAMGKRERVLGPLSLCLD